MVGENNKWSHLFPINTKTYRTKKNHKEKYHFKIWLDCHKLKKIPCLIMPMSTKCQKK
jgi:hypothetical protein